MKGNSQMSRMQGKTFSKPSHQGQVFVGIDVSKRHLDVHIHPDDIWHRVTNDKVGHELLARHLKQRSVRLVVMEATGRYHRLVHRHLSDAGFHVAVMNPYRTRKFADMLGKLAKTDKIDAKTLALFAEMVRPDATTPPVPSMAILTEQLVARRQINEERVALQSQLNETTVPTIARQIRARIKMCQRHQLALEKDIRGAIQQSDVLQRRFDILTSIPGIALITAATLIAELGGTRQYQCRKGSRTCRGSPHELRLWCMAWKT
jgi:transposase